MAYSTSTQLRANVPRLNTTVLPDADADLRIDEADKQIRSDLNNIIDFTLVTDTPGGCPVYINKLSQYKTAELSLVRAFSSKRMDVQITDWEYWQTQYKELLNKILNGEINVSAVSDGTDTFQNRSRSGIEPALGQGEYSEYVNNDDLETIREKYGNQDE